MPKMKYVVNGCAWAHKKQEVWRQRGSQEMWGKDMKPELGPSQTQSFPAEKFFSLFVFCFGGQAFISSSHTGCCHFF